MTEPVIEPDYFVVKIVYRTRNRGERHPTEFVHFKPLREGTDHIRAAEDWCHDTNVTLLRCPVVTSPMNRYAARKLVTELKKARRLRFRAERRRSYP